MKKKLLALLLSTAMVLSLVACGGKEEAPAEAPAATEEAEAPAEEAPAEEAAPEYEEINLVFSFFGTEECANGQAMKLFKEQIEERSGGKVTVELHYNGTLYNQQNEYAALQKGDVDFIVTGLNGAMEYITELQSTFLPYLWKNIEHYNYFWFESEKGQEMMARVQDELDVHYIGFATAGDRNVELTIDKKVTSLADLSGVKLRSAASENMLAMVESLGANPVPIGFGDTYLGLQTGLADGLEGDLPAVIESGFVEVLKSITMTKHTPGVDGIAASQKNFETWSPALQELVMEVGQEAVAFSTETALKAETDKRGEIEAAGIIIYDLTDEEREAYGKEVMEKFLSLPYAENYDMELVEAINSIRDQF